MARRGDVVFSSEKIESRERLKRILIPLAVLAAIIAVVVIAALMTSSFKGKVYTGGEDTPYPYRWSNNKGVMTLEIDHSAAKGMSWVALNNDSVNIPTEAVKRQPKNASRFTVTPADTGRFTDVFVLVDENGAGWSMLRLMTDTTLDEKGVLQTEVAASNLKMLQPEQNGGADTYFPYTFGPVPDGYIALTVSGGAIADDWIAVSDNERSVRDAGLFYEDGNVTLYLAPGDEPGTAGVRLSSEQGAVSIALEAELMEGGDFIIREHRIEGGDVSPAAEQEGDGESGDIAAEDQAEGASQSPEFASEEHAEEYTRLVQEIIDTAPDTATMLSMLEELQSEYEMQAPEGHAPEP